jgi:predicted dienelactone hydrolase
MGNGDVSGFVRKTLRFARWRVAAARHTALFAALLAACPAATLAQGTRAASFSVGMRQLEYVDAIDGGRHLALTVFYPAVGRLAAARFGMPFFANLELYKDAEPAFDGTKRPLVMFSHGRGSNGLYYAWFGEFLASRGYIVATQPDCGSFRFRPTLPSAPPTPRRRPRTTPNSRRSISPTPSLK